MFSISHAHFKDFPELRNGNRLLLMSVSNPIPSSFNVLGFVWHPGQPVQCTICKESGHLPRACPFSGLCRRCKKPGHVARECGQAGGQPRPLLLFQLILFLMTGTCPLSPRTILIQFLFRRSRPLLLMIFLADLGPSILNVFRPSQLPFSFLRLKYLSFQSPNLSLFVSKYCFV